MDWVLIFKVVVYSLIFLAVEALVVHVYIRWHGDNWGRLILKTIITCYVIAISLSAAVGSVTYVLLSGLK